MKTVTTTKMFAKTEARAALAIVVIVASVMIAVVAAGIGETEGQTGRAIREEIEREIAVKLTHTNGNAVHSGARRNEVIWTRSGFVADRGTTREDTAIEEVGTEIEIEEVGGVEIEIETEIGEIIMTGTGTLRGGVEDKEERGRVSTTAMTATTVILVIIAIMTVLTAVSAVASEVASTETTTDTGIAGMEGTQKKAPMCHPTCEIAVVVAAAVVVVVVGDGETLTGTGETGGTGRLTETTSEAGVIGIKM